MANTSFRTAATILDAKIKVEKANPYQSNSTPHNSIIVTLSIDIRAPRAPMNLPNWLDSWDGGARIAQDLLNKHLRAAKAKDQADLSKERLTALEEATATAQADGYATYTEKRRRQNRGAAVDAQRAALLLALIGQPVILQVEPPGNAFEEMFGFLAATAPPELQEPEQENEP